MLTPVNLKPVHPGEILRDELEALGLTPYAFARAIDVSPTRVAQIVACKRSITPESALRLARYFGSSAKFWLNLQQNFDLKQAERMHGRNVERAVRPRAAA
jgi:addiction module HigA family antidote